MNADAGRLSIQAEAVEHGVVIVRLVGEASVGEVPALERAVTRLMAGMPDRMILDLTGLAFASSLAIGQLMGLLQAARSKKRPAAVVCPPGGDIEGVLLRSRTNLLAPVVGTVEGAVRALHADDA